jgi:SAM-dependent methyltransferase
MRAVKHIVKKVIPSPAVRALRPLLNLARKHASVSSEYEILAGEPLTIERDAGWQHPSVATRQRAAFVGLLDEMKCGHPRADFAALAEAVTVAGAKNPTILELGCGSGWNWLVLDVLFKKPFRYTGLDCSPAMIEMARRDYPRGNFILGDALDVPGPDGCCDILVSGTVLMHLANYREAIRESRRLARHWCVFHTVPVLQFRETTFLRKRAYGKPTIEVIFNETELLDLFCEFGMELRATFESIPYNLEFLLAEPTTTRTYLCAVIS